MAIDPQRLAEIMQRMKLAGGPAPMGAQMGGPPPGMPMGGPPPGMPPQGAPPPGAGALRRHRQAPSQ